MISMILIVAILIAVFFVQKVNPLWAGLIAVIPVKIIGTTIITSESGNLEPAIRGMLIGQFFWGFVLLVAWMYLKYCRLL